MQSLCSFNILEMDHEIVDTQSKDGVNILRQNFTGALMSYKFIDLYLRFIIDCMIYHRLYIICNTDLFSV